MAGLGDVPAPARLLGFGGLIPFLGLGLLPHLAPGAAAWSQPLLAGYGATILAFMGGCRWGFASAGLGEGPTLRLLGLSVLPSLWAWLALAAPFPFDLDLLALGLALLYLADLKLKLDGGAPAWWPALRLPLTLGAAAGLLLGAAAG